MEGALDRPRDPLPTRVQDLAPLPDGVRATTLDAGPRALGLDPRARRARPRSTPTCASCSPGPRPSTSRPSATRPTSPGSTSWTRWPPCRTSRAPRDRRGCWTSGPAAGSRACRSPRPSASDRALLVDSVGKKVRFLRTVVEATGLERRVAAEQARAEALARDPRDREAWPAVTARAVASLAELVELGLPLVAPGRRARRLEARARSTRSSTAPRAPCAALRAGPVAVVRRRRPRPRGPPPRHRPARRAASTPASRATRRSVVGGPSDAVRRRRPAPALAPPLRYPPPRCASPSSPTSTRTSTALDAVLAADPVRGRGLAPGRRRGLRAAPGRGRRAAPRARRRRRARQPRRRGPRRPRDRVLQRGCAPGDGVDARDDRATRRGPGWPPSRRRLEREGFTARPRQPAGSDLGVRDLDARGPGRHGRDGDPLRPPRPHAPADRLHRGGRPAGDDEPGVRLAS